MLQKDKSKVKEIIEEDIWGSIKYVLELGPSFGEGDNKIDITVGLLLLLIFTFFITRFLLKWLRHFLTRKMQSEDKLKFISVFKFIRYVVYVAVILITMSAVGIDITLLLTASAALFIGLGLALQDLFKDIIGGIFIITDKSLHVGDIIEVDGKVGKVFEIKLRTTRAITRDDKVIVIPNHHFITDIIYNYTQNHKTTRERIIIGVAYGSNVELVTEILMDIAKTQKGVLKNPKPFVMFDDFGDSALMFSLNVYLNDSFSDPRMKSEMRYKIDARFRENGVTIPFPQRDVHLFQPAPFQVRSNPTSDNGRPKSDGPDDGRSENDGPENDGPEDGLPEDGLPEDGLPEDGRPIRSNPKNKEPKTKEPKTKEPKSEQPKNIDLENNRPHKKDGK